MRVPPDNLKDAVGVTACHIGEIGKWDGLIPTDAVGGGYHKKDCKTAYQNGWQFLQDFGYPQGQGSRQDILSRRGPLSSTNICT